MSMLASTPTTRGDGSQARSGQQVAALDPHAAIALGQRKDTGMGSDVTVVADGLQPTLSESDA